MSCQRRYESMPHSFETWKRWIREDEDMKPDVNTLITLTRSAPDLESIISRRSTLELSSLICSGQSAPDLHKSWNFTETLETSSDEEWPESVPSKANSVCYDTRVLHHHVPRCSFNRNSSRESYFLNKHTVNPGDPEGVWEHDLYNDAEQTPKSDEQIVSEYGRNIRKLRNPMSPRRK